jgi:ElaB/YqjD/DUF883 family membrane-anchored ribosome-binding protein
MADKKQQDIFTSRVLPIMKKVHDELASKQAAEYKRHSTSFGALLAGAAGPDGGMAATDAYNQRLQILGEWNSKTVDDYIEMVKKELQRQHITVDAVMEKKMIDYLVNEQMPKSSAEYILRKSAEGSIFYIDKRVRQTSLQQHINKEGDKKYNASFLEDAAGAIGSWITNALSTMGFGGFWGQAAMDASTTIVESTATGQQDNYKAEQRKKGQQEVAQTQKKKADVPQWMLSQMGFKTLSDATDKQLSLAAKWAKDNAARYRNKVNKALNDGERTVKAAGKSSLMTVSDATYRTMQYEAFAASIQKEQTNRKNLGKDAVSFSNVMEADDTLQNQVMSNTEDNGNTENMGNADNTDNTQTTTGDYAGWNSLLSSMGLSGMGDTMQHLGLTLSMLPDMLIGVFTGRTKSIGMNQGTMMPLAALISGTFVKNPLLKIPLILYGGANLVNKMGQEALADYRGENNTSQATQYKRYADEELNSRIKNPQIEGNILLMDIDGTPRLVTLPQNVVEAYQQGAIPINVIANRILDKADQSMMSQQRTVTDNVSDHYEQNREREQARGIR